MRIGDKVTFVPAGFIEYKAHNSMIPPGTKIRVTGTVVGIHKAHRYCRVKFEVHGYTMYECFKILSLEDQINENNRNPEFKRRGS